MNPLFDKRLVIGLALIALLLLGSATLGYLNTKRLDEDVAWVAHTHEVLDLASDVLRTLVDAETGERGFIITGKDDHLRPYESARQRLGGLLATLREKTADNPTQQERIQRLQDLTSRRMNRLTTGIALRRKSLAEAQAFVGTGEGTAQMDTIRAVVADIVRTEHELLETRQQQSRRSYLVAQTSTAVTAALGLAMVAAFYGVLRHSLSARQKVVLALHEQREWFRTTLHSIGDAVIVTDAHGRVSFLNPTAATLTGWTVAEAAGQPLEEVFRIVNEETRKAAENPAMRALREGNVVGLANHTVLLGRDGTERAIDDSAAPIRDGNGTLTGVVLVFRDVTEQRRGERAARFLAAIVASSDDAIIGKDASGIITSWNQAAARLFGYTAAEAIGRPVAMLAPPDRADEMPAILARIKRGEQVDHFDTVRRTKDGRLVPISLTVSPIKDADGHIIGASKIARDISERRRAEEAVREEKARLHTTLLSIGDAVIVTDTDSRITIMNPVAQALTGWQDEATGRPLADVFRIINEQTRQPVDSPVSRVIREGTVVGLANHTVLIARDGRETPIDDSGAPVRNSAGEIVAVVLVFRDIRERRRIEQELRDAARRKDEFLATLAHELRNPLAPIRNAVELMRRAQGDAAVMEQARSMLERQVAQMVRLIDELLDISRITSGKLQLHKECVALAAAVQTALEVSQPLIDAQAHELSVTMPEESVDLDADPTRLAQIISNLLNNAAKYTHKGGHIWLTVERQGREAVICVRDNGIGIPAQHLPRLFQMFSQVAPALERSQEGLGIGLALVRGLVELHGGTIAAHSGGAGLGSEFVVRLPVADGAAQPAAAAPVDEKVRPRSGTSCRILVADDNRDAASSLAMMLQMMGHQVQTAHDGVEAVQAAAVFHPEVVMLDIGMPKMNGYEAARHIREQPWGRNVLLVALTGWGQEEDKRRAVEAGFHHHLIKPVEPAALERLLEGMTRPPI
jgi:PAS domain S-box-containing protein